MNAASLITLAAMAANQYNPDQLTIKSLDLDELYMVSKHHQMTAIAAYALASAGISDSRFIEDQAKAIRKNIILDNDRRDILAAFEDAHIWYMPLKGIVMKNYYPEIGMRQMSDNDILFDASRAEEVRNIMEGLGFTTIHFGEGHQDDYQKPPVSHFEMHRMLFAPTADILFYEYYRDIEKKLIVGKGYERYFSNEDFYIYMITHEYKHFTWNGTGLRSLLDTYVYLKKFRDTMDWNYIESEIRKLGVSEFEKKNRELAIKVFSVSPQGKTNLEVLNEEEVKFLELFISAGTYGNKKRGIQNRVARDGAVKYIFRRIFLPLNSVKQSYPLFYYHRILLPFLPFYRLLKGWRNAKAETKILLKK